MTYQTIKFHLGIASFAQQRLWMDEQVRFDESIHKRTAVYNELLIYKLRSTRLLSLEWFRHALELIVAKHPILRTALVYEQDKLIQRILPISDASFDFKVTFIEDEMQSKRVLADEETNVSLFNLGQGRVFRCHVLHYLSGRNDNGTNLKPNDIIVFNFHHIAIDRSSIPIFINDLRQALTLGNLYYDGKDNISYLDYAQYERLEDWSAARQFWSSALESLKNSTHQQNPSIRTGRGYTVTFDLNHDLVIRINQFMSQSYLTLFQVGLAAFFVLLFKLSNSERLDVCIGIVAANRSHYQLQNMIGFFANTLPFCLRIDPYESFIQLCYRVQQNWHDILPHLHLPYQEMIKLNKNIGSSFVRTQFQAETIIDSDEQIIKLNDGTALDMIHRNLLTDNIAKFDMACALYENRRKETISVSLNASLDLYDESTITAMASRFQGIFGQLLSIPSVCEVSLLLPHELQLMHDLNDTFRDYGRLDCIHHQFADQAMQHPQKLALELDQQSLTYCELLYYVQLLSLYFLNNCGVSVGDIICQCVDRSISMVSG